VRIINVFFISFFSVICLGHESITVSTVQIARAGFIKESTPQGIYYDIANLIVKEAGYKVNNTILPYPRVIESLASGKSDMSILISTQTTNKICDPVIELSKIKSIVVGLKGKRIHSLFDLKGKTVAVFRQANYGPIFDKNETIKKYEVNSYDQALKMLFSGRLQAIAGYQNSIHHTLKQQGYDVNILATPLVINRQSISVQYSKRSAHPNAKKLIKAAAQRLVSQGKYKEIVEKYTGIID